MMKVLSLMAFTTSLNFDLLNFCIAVIALLVAIYSLYYTKRFNRRRITVVEASFLTSENDPPLAQFEIVNLSPVPITVEGVSFRSVLDTAYIQPLMDYEPKQTYHAHMPDFIPDYKYADPLTRPQVVQPHSSLELSYYFGAVYQEMQITVACKERIHHFRRMQSFIVHFDECHE